MQVLEEVKKAINLLNLQNSVYFVEDDGKLYLELLNHFVQGSDRRWWWESFKEDSKSITFDDGKGFDRISSIVPTSEEIVWFVVEDDQLPYYPIFECTITNAIKIVSECFAFEYYLIPKNKSWLICENHHNRIIGVGNQVTQSINKYAM